MKCKYCEENVLLDEAANHACFIGKQIFMDEENNLFVQSDNEQLATCDESASINENLSTETCNTHVNKQPAVWDKNTTLALLSLYEMKIEMLDHPKRKTKIWEAISTDLQENFGIQMTTDQVRWKMNALIKKYKECVDNNCKSGRSPMTFEWYDQLDEIFGQQGNAAASHTVSSNLAYLRKSSSSSAQKRDSNKSSTITSKNANTLLTSKNANTLLTRCSNENVQMTTSSDSEIQSPASNKRKRPLHGTGSNIAKTKVEIENQWLEYIKTKTERDKLNDEKHAATFEQKKEILKLKKKKKKNVLL
ncbi:uncharacterized protein [Temnothorax longispinosus]|uniref:uncharacterized protein n=1 Tax=Temnothorax longispinosus TaxID=300112 RepID=UPI003A99500C